MEPLRVYEILFCVMYLVSLAFPHTSAQPGFLSLLCGGNENYKDDQISWTNDANYINVGKSASIVDPLLPSYMKNLRYFPTPLNKSCYNLPMKPMLPYLVRLWFRGSSTHHGSFTYSIETQGTLFTMLTIEVSASGEPLYSEYVIKSLSTNLYICLLRNPDSVFDPFINAIELRELVDGMYTEVQPGTLLRIRTRRDFGATAIIRYPNDTFDRIWNVLEPGYKTTTVGLNYSTDQIPNLPPQIVMQTQASIPTHNLTFIVQYRSPQIKARTVLYYLGDNVNISAKSENTGNEVYLEKLYHVSKITSVVNQENINSDEIIMIAYKGNFSAAARESYDIMTTDNSTNENDMNALYGVKEHFGMKEWLSDPCYVVPWQGITCENQTVIGINLSGRNFSMPIPSNIDKLAQLRFLYLDDNRLIGGIPDLSSLVMLERLHLQNNNLSGSFPTWLSKLQNLKELLLQGNNFEGTIPEELFKKSSSMVIKVDENVLPKGNLTSNQPTKQPVDNQASNKKGNWFVIIVAAAAAAYLCGGNMHWHNQILPNI